MDFASLVKRHRLSAVANGVLTGMGIFIAINFTILGPIIGLVGMVGIIAGVGMEVLQRRRIPPMTPEIPLVKRHRLSALANGVLVGMGLFILLLGGLGGLFGIVGIVAGVGLEIWQRNRVSKELG